MAPRFKDINALFSAVENSESEELLEELTDLLHDTFSRKATELCNHGGIAVIGGLCLILGPAGLLHYLNDTQPTGELNGNED